MKLKVLVSNLLAAVLISGVSVTVTSCKDNDSDIMAQLREDDANLQAQIDALNAKMLKCKDDCKAAVLAEVTDLLKGYQLKGDYVTEEDLNKALANYVLKTTLATELEKYYTKSQIDELLDELEQCQCEIKTEAQLQQWLMDNGYITKEYITYDNLVDILNTYKGSVIDGAISDAIADALKGYYTQEEINDLLDKIKNCLCEIKTKAELQQWLIDNGYITSEYITYDNLVSILNTYKQNVLDGAYLDDEELAEALKSYVLKTDLNKYLTIEAFNAMFEGTDFTTLTEALIKLTNTASDLETLSSEYTQFMVQYAEDQQALETYKQSISNELGNIDTTLGELQNQINAITGRLNKLITSIVMQQIYNPVFGSISLPMDVESNILLGLYGNPSNEGTFPDSDTMNAYNGNDGNLFTDEDMLFLANNCGLSTYKFDATTKFFSGDQATNRAELGYVYMTVNPVANDFSGVTLGLEQSNGEASLVKLAPLTPSNDVIKFGYTRGASANGFYESQATIAVEDMPKIKVEIQEGLKTAVKDAWKNRTYSDLANVAKLVYRQFEGFLPALAIRAGWMDGDTPNAVYSKYNIAATAYKPLSFSFLYDKSFRHNWHIPDSWWNYQLNFEVPTIHWDIEELAVVTPNVKFTLPRRQISYGITDDKIDVTMGMPRFSAGAFTGIVTETFSITNIDHFMDAYKARIHAAIAGNEGSYKADFELVEDQIIAQMQKLYDNAVINVEYKVTDNLEIVLNDIQDQLNSKISKFTNKLDRFRQKIEAAINRVNSFLADPNHYLQPVLLYGNNSSYYKMSEAKTWPTTLKVEGGNAITMIATTYNAEIIAPCFKKFLAVTDVYTADGSARLGNAGCLAALKKANSQPYMCQPFDGRRVTFPLYLEKVGGKNTTYEIVYQGLDYHGKVSTIKSYVTIK